MSSEYERQPSDEKGLPKFKKNDEQFVCLDVGKRSVAAEVSEVCGTHDQKVEGTPDQEFAKLQALIQNSEATIQQRQAALADARAAFSEIPRSSPDSERLWQELQELIPVVEVP